MITESPDQYFKAIHVEIYGVSTTYTNDESDEDLKPKNMNKEFSSVETQTE